MRHKLQKRQHKIRRIQVARAMLLHRAPQCMAIADVAAKQQRGAVRLRERHKRNRCCDGRGGGGAGGDCGCIGGQRRCSEQKTGLKQTHPPPKVVTIRSPTDRGDLGGDVFQLFQVFLEQKSGEESQWQLKLNGTGNSFSSPW